MARKLVTKNDKETKNLGKQFARELKPGETLLLYGDLGAGKTTFVQGLAEGLGIKDRILSPTFVLHRVHKANFNGIKTLNHIDLYRLEGKQAIDSLGLGETVDDEEGLTVIEWADKLTDLKPKKGYELRFAHTGENQREITVDELS
jgi:tRNA threonylcarbamoyladenosine biosynthesis protein TsaE